MMKLNTSKNRIVKFTQFDNCSMEHCLFQTQWDESLWFAPQFFLYWQSGFNSMEVLGHSRSVMPFDTLGRTRHTIGKEMSETKWTLLSQMQIWFNVSFCGFSKLKHTTKSFKFFINQDRTLQLLFVNKEYLVNVIHDITLTTSLAFVHTARRFYRLIVKERNWEIEMKILIQTFSIHYY